MAEQSQDIKAAKTERAHREQNFLSKKIPTIFIGLLFVAGIAILFYPLASEWQTAHNQAIVIENYNNATSELEKEEIEALREAAVEYNKSLLGNVVLTDPFDVSMAKEKSERYESLLNVEGSGVMGVVSIPKIGAKLPIYHGTSLEVLERGAGHLENTSLPVGGIGSHAVISAHNGLPQARLFTNLETIQEGDIFFVEVLGETLAYKVNQIKVVEPDDTSSLLIDTSKDYLTLVTCTPYGVNSHRLLVRGERTDYTESLEELLSTQEGAEFVLARPYVFAGLIATLLIVLYAVRRLWKRRSSNAR